MSCPLAESEWDDVKVSVVFKSVVNWLIGDRVHIFNRLLRGVISALAVSLSLLVLNAAPAASHEGHDHSREIRVLEVSGLLDPIEVDYIESELEDAQRDWALAVVLQVNSPGAAGETQAIRDLILNIESSLVPVGAWIGESGATAQGASAYLVQAADFSGIAPGSQIGRFKQFELNQDMTPDVAADSLERGQDAVDISLVDVMAPTLGDFLLAMEDAGLVEQISQELDQADGLIQRSVADDVRVTFNKLSLLDQIFHTAASPAVAYLLLLVGMSMLLLDFFTGGVGVAGVVGCVSLLLSAYGLGVLDVRLWALVALIVAMLGFAVDLQSGVPRFWTSIGVVSLISGSFGLYGSHSLSWLTLLGGIGLVLVFMLSGMPALIRTRYGTSTLGREWMIGKMAEAATDLSPEGIVVYENAQWRARVNRLTPISQGEAARIVGLEGLVLEVEPEEGGAVDYREMRNKASESSLADAPEEIE